MTSLLIRLVLDRAASTSEAIELINKYDMVAVAGHDYHFFISDASGDSRIIEYDCDSPLRETVVTPVRQATNFFELYKDRVKPNQKNGKYGHGRERYDAIEHILDAANGQYTYDIAWEALIAASQEPKEEDITSNTQWSVIYNNTDLSAHIAIRRQWEDVFKYKLESNEFF